MSMRCVVVVAGLVIAHSTFGQASENTGPGGVGNNAGTSSLVVWLAADKGVVFNSKVDNSIFQLSDLSGYANHAIRYDRANSPTLIPNALNGMPLARFDGIDDYLSIVSNASIELKQWSFFLVAKVNKHKDFNCFFVKGRDGEENFEFLSYADAKVQFPIRYTNNERSNDVFADGVSNTVFRIYQYDNDNINLTHYANLAQKFTKAEPRIPNSKNINALEIGYDAVPGFGNLSGDIAEFLVYDKKVNSTQQVIISNYLSAKYGLTLSGLFFTYDIYTMDNPANGNYDFDVAGIGQVSVGSSQKDSRGSGIVRMVVESAASMTNGEFLLWGHDNSDLNSFVVKGGDIDGTVIQERLKRIWRVSEAGDVGTVTISFDINSIGGPTRGSHLRLLIDRDGDGFADNDVTPVGNGTYVDKVITFSKVDLKSGDRFTLGNTDITRPLPIELLSFTAVPENNTVKLNWSTASEMNNDHFAIQRSVDGEAWEDVSRIESARNKSTSTDYETTDNQPHNGISYYRLKQVDLDGRYSYSKIGRVEIVEKKVIGLKAYPNPVIAGSFHVVTGFDIEPEDVQVVDMMGKPLPLRIFKNHYEEGVRVEAINSLPGIYVLQV